MSSGKQARPRRRWYTGEEIDLIVWFSEQGRPDGSQLCYDRKGHERALTWTETTGYRHDRIDDGEGNPTKNRSPILVSDGVFPAADVLKRFETSSIGIETHIKEFVTQKLREYATKAAKV
jgi:hypothetical protein